MMNQFILFKQFVYTFYAKYQFLVQPYLDSDQISANFKWMWDLMKVPVLQGNIRALPLFLYILTFYWLETNSKQTAQLYYKAKAIQVTNYVRFY